MNPIAEFVGYFLLGGATLFVVLGACIAVGGWLQDWKVKP